jgi:hypothetical protein
VAVTHAQNGQFAPNKFTVKDADGQPNLGAFGFDLIKKIQGFIHTT